MQPNQQDPNQQPAPLPPPQAPVSEPPTAQQTPVQSNPYAVPDYLHMDPVVVGQPQKSDKKRIIIVAVLVSALLVGGGAIAFVASQQITPQEKFYRALEKNLQVKYLSRTLTNKWQNPVESPGYDAKALLQNEDKSLSNLDTSYPSFSMTATIDSDLSSPAKPISHLTYDYKETSKKSTARSYAGENTTTSSTNYFELFKSASTTVKLRSLQLNQWYHASPPATNSKSLAYDLYDHTDSNAALVLYTLNSAQGLIPVGNFSSDQVTQIMSYIRTHAIYNLQTIQSTNDNNQSATMYTVKIVRSALNDFNTKLASLLGITQVHVMATTEQTNDELKFWVDDTTGQFSKLSYTVKYNDNVVIEQATSFSYPTKLSILQPENVKDKPAK